jgi:hypothetical protein
MGAATYRLKLQPVAIVTEIAAAVATDDALVVNLAGAFSRGVSAPGVSPLGTASIVAFQQICDSRGQLVAGGAFGLGVLGAGPIVGVQDHPHRVGGGVFVAPAHLVHLSGVEQVAVLVVALPGRSGVNLSRRVCRVSCGAVPSRNTQLSGPLVSILSQGCRAVFVRLGTLLAHWGFRPSGVRLLRRRVAASRYKLCH